MCGLEFVLPYHPPNLPKDHTGRLYPRWAWKTIQADADHSWHCDRGAEPVRQCYWQSSVSQRPNQIGSEGWLPHSGYVIASGLTRGLHQLGGLCWLETDVTSETSRNKLTKKTVRRHKLLYFFRSKFIILTQNLDDKKPNPWVFWEMN